MERCSISPVARLCYTPVPLLLLLLLVLVTPPSTCNREDEGPQEDALSVQLSVTAQVTPTPLWAVVWGPTQPLDDDNTYHFLSSQETDPLLHHPKQHGGPQEPDNGDNTASSSSTAQGWQDAGHSSMRPAAKEKTPPAVEPMDQEGVQDAGTTAEGTEPEEVDPQFYVTVTISSLLILTAVGITAKLCYDRSCSQHPAPLSRGVVAPPLSLALPRSLPSEDSRQTLHSTSSSLTDRERIPVVNL